MAPLIEIKNLHAGFETPKGFLKAVDGLSLSIEPGQAAGLVGESGCGKSATANAILQLLPQPIGKVTEGEILFEGRDLLKLNEAELCEVRGREISMIFQEPMSALNPVMRIGQQIAEPLLIHKLVKDKKEAMAKAVEMLDKVGIPEPDKRAKLYPHELSGGMRQRALIAMALITHPKLVIADEPTTALDATLQTQILDLLGSLQKEFSLAVLFITHDLGLVKKLCNTTTVMYAGQAVESATTADLFKAPQHPYTQGLLASRPSEAIAPKTPLQTIPGRLPSFFEWEQGCRFRPRCPYATEACKAAQELENLSDSHTLRCAPKPLSQKENA